MTMMDGLLLMSLKPIRRSAEFTEILGIIRSHAKTAEPRLEEGLREFHAFAACGRALAGPEGK